MCLEDQTTMIKARETFTPAAQKCVGSTISNVVRQAECQGRLTVGLLPAIRRLATECDAALFCLLAPAASSDPAHHMHEVLLQAFCLENDIYILKVDSSEKLHKLIPSHSLRDCSCILIHHPYLDPYSDRPKNMEHLSAPDKLLAEHCESVWGLQPTPVIRLPEQ